MKVAESELELLRLELKLHTGINQLLFSPFSILLLKRKYRIRIENAKVWVELESRKLTMIKIAIVWVESESE